MSCSSPRWRRVLTAVGAAVLVCGAVAGCTSGGNTRTFCDAVRGGEDPLALFGRYDPGDLENGNEQLDQAVGRLRQLHEAAPTQIEEAVKTLVDTAEQIAEALKARAPGANPGGESSAPPRLNVDDAKVAEASAEVMAFAQDRCGVTLGATATTASS